MRSWPWASGLAGYVELYRASAVSFPSRRDYGLSGKITRIVPDTDENLAVFRKRLRENLVLAQSEALAVAETPLGSPLYGEMLSLSRLEPDVAAGRALAVSGRRARIQLRAGKPYPILNLTEGGSLIVSEGDSLRLAGPPEEQSGSTWNVLAPAVFAARINQSSSKKLRLLLLDREGRTGTLEIAAAAIEQAPALDDDETVQEIAFIDDLATAVVHDRDQGFTRFTLAAALKRCYDRETARVSAAADWRLAIARRYEGDEPNAAWLVFSSFAWGGERIQVDSLDVPQQALDRQHTLIAGENGTFEVFDDDDRLVLKGKAGTRASDQGYSILVAQLRARPDTQFRLTKRSAEAAIDDLRRNYSVKNGERSQAFSS